MRWNNPWLWAGAVALFGLTGCQRPRSEAPLPFDSGWLIDAESYYASAHGDLECTECHREMMEEDELYPHGATPLVQDYAFDEKACERCHAAAFKLAEKDIHAKAAEEEARARTEGRSPASLSRTGSLAPHCADCHPIHHRSPQGEE